MRLIGVDDLSERIIVPEANLRNIPIFEKDPCNNTALIGEIKQHIQLTSSPHTWRGHSHTKPDKGAFVVYVEEYDVPAPKHVLKVAPCPCCNPHYPKYKNKGKIAWFPNESIIRLIGPDCFVAINAGGHHEALIELRKRQKRRSELETIALHSRNIDALIESLEEALPIAKDLDEFMQEIHRVLDNQMQLNLWREVKGGDLTILETRRVPFQKADGTYGARNEDFKVFYRRIQGHSMIDGTGQSSATKLKHLRSGLVAMGDVLKKTDELDSLSDLDRRRMADALPKGRIQAAEILLGMVERQRFLTTDAVPSLNDWAQQPTAPIPFSMQRRKCDVVISATIRQRGAPITCVVSIGANAIKSISSLPPL